MTETYQPPIRPMDEVLPRLTPELAPESNFALMTMVQAIASMENHGFVQQQDDGSYTFASIPEKIAAAFGGPVPNPEAFTFSAADMIRQGDGSTVPFSNEALAQALGKTGTGSLEVVRMDQQGVPHNFEIKLASFYGNGILVAQINDITEQKQSEALSRRVEQLDLLKQARIAIDGALNQELGLKHPSEDSFLKHAMGRLKEVLGEGNVVELGLYRTSILETEATIELSPMAQTAEMKSVPLAREFIQKARDITREKFPAASYNLNENIQGIHQVTAVASFPDREDSTLQKLLVVYSKENLSESATEQLPYIMQEMNYALEKLRATIKVHSQLEKTHTELKNAMYEARVDKLTSIPNRRWFVEKVLADLSELERRIEAGEKDVHLGLIFGDIDKFKDFNETFGHPIGDLVLSEVAGTLDNGKRAEDFVARFGGEEFLITIPNEDIRGLLRAADRHRQAIKAKTHTFTDKHGKTHNKEITMSFGVVPMEQVLSQITLDDVERALGNKKIIRFVSQQEVADSKAATNGNGNKIIQPDLTFDPGNPRKSLHDIRMIIAFEQAHAISSQVNSAAKHGGRDCVYRADWDDIDQRWEAKGPGETQIIDMTKIEYTQMIVQGTYEDYRAALEQEKARKAA